MQGNDGGAWTSATHNRLHPGNLNQGLARFISEVLQPTDILEFGSGEGVLATALGKSRRLEPSYCIEPLVDQVFEAGLNLNLLNLDIFRQPAPLVLDRTFDLLLSIEVAEHVERDRHEALFDFLAARAGRWVVFSGARPGQGGHGHVAERPEMEWRSEWTQRGFLFDDRMTALARNRCDPRNINHRRNVMVFRAPSGFEALSELEARARPYLRDLLSIVQAHKAHLIGNLFYVDMQGAQGGRPEDSLKIKRDNLVSVAGAARNVLDIGFNAGHSALLFLLCNPECRVTAVDTFEPSYSNACFDYLARVFPGRLTREQGDSRAVLPRLAGQAFDLVHLDGGKELTIRQDLAAIPGLVARDHLLVIDDTQNQALNDEVVAAVRQGDLQSGAFSHRNQCALSRRWTHLMSRVLSPEPDPVLEQVETIYRDTTFASIYTSSDRSARESARARAAALVEAIQTVEEAGVPGAFVEVGVAAGHSSVIAGLTASRFLPRDFWLFDTFEGFGEALPDEVDLHGKSIRDYDLDRYTGDDCSIDTVRSRMLATGVCEDRLYLVKGPAEQTVERFDPGQIAVLRLDADLYAPTMAALRAFYPRLAPGGFLIVDDYGHWRGCQQAVDDYFAERGESFQGLPADYTCYVARR